MLPLGSGPQRPVNDPLNAVPAGQHNKDVEGVDGGQCRQREEQHPQPTLGQQARPKVITANIAATAAATCTSPLKEVRGLLAGFHWSRRSLSMRASSQRREHPELPRCART
jgi:hypothetical protein